MSTSSYSWTAAIVTSITTDSCSTVCVCDCLRIPAISLTHTSTNLGLICITVSSGIPFRTDCAPKAANRCVLQGIQAKLPRNRPRIQTCAPTKRQSNDTNSKKIAYRTSIGNSRHPASTFRRETPLLNPTVADRKLTVAAAALAPLSLGRTWDPEQQIESRSAETKQELVDGYDGYGIPHKVRKRVGKILGERRRQLEAQLSRVLGSRLLWLETADLSKSSCFAIL